ACRPCGWDVGAQITEKVDVAGEGLVGFPEAIPVPDTVLLLQLLYQPGMGQIAAGGAIPLRRRSGILKERLRHFIQGFDRHRTVVLVPGALHRYEMGPNHRWGYLRWHTKGPAARWRHIHI